MSKEAKIFLKNFDLILLRELKQGLCDRLKGGMGREMGGRCGREGHGCTYG